MLNGLSLLRPRSVKAFRGVRFFLYLLFWMFFAVMIAGVITEMLAPRTSVLSPLHKDSHDPTQR